MEVFRLAREKYAIPLTGKGAAIKGGRWNSEGIELIYTAQNRSLAMAEVAVHFTLATLPDDYVMITINIPDDIFVTRITEEVLPENWKIFPHPTSTKEIGDNFVIESKSCVLIIPSAITKGDYNLLINPNHPEFIKIRITSIEKFPFDARLFK